MVGRSIADISGGAQVITEVGLRGYRPSYHTMYTI